MVADQPMVVYPKDRKATKKSMDNAYARWKERKEKEGDKTLVGRQVSLKDFLK